MTISYKPEEKDDVKHVEEYIRKKTGGKVRVVSFAVDLREEEQCAKLIESHLGAQNGKLDILCVYHCTSRTYATYGALQSLESWYPECC